MKKQSKKMVQKMKKNQFDFEDYLESMQQMKKMGGIGALLSMMPGMGGNQMKQLEDAVDEKKMARIEAIILSMTVEGASESGCAESIQKAEELPMAQVWTSAR